MSTSITPQAPPPSLTASAAPRVTTAQLRARLDDYRRRQAVEAIEAIQSAYREGRAIPTLV